MKKILFFAGLMLCSTIMVKAQSLMESLYTNSTESSKSVVVKAVQPALSIIRQQYRLEYKGKFFGKNNQPYYGETYSLAIKISGGTYILHNVLYPWESDPSYQHISQGGKYAPVLYWTMQHSLTDSIWKRVDLELEKKEYIKLSHDSLLFQLQDATSNFGLPELLEDERLEGKQGYMVWAYASTNIQDSVMRVNLRQESFQIDETNDSQLVSLNPYNSEKLIGGLYVVPKIERAGFITIQLAGIVAKDKNSKWMLCLLTKKTDSQDKTDEPIKKDRGKRKKNGESESKSEETVDDFEPTPIK